MTRREIRRRIFGLLHEAAEKTTYDVYFQKNPSSRVERASGEVLDILLRLSGRPAPKRRSYENPHQAKLFD